MRESKWEARSRRARELAADYPFAAEALGFYERIACFQKSLYLFCEGECGTENAVRLPGSLRDELDISILLPRFGSFLSMIDEHAPGPLSSVAVELRAEGVGRWQEELAGFWRGNGTESADRTNAISILAWTFLQPYAEYLADHTQTPWLDGTPRECPLCGGMPQVGVLRPEGDGAKRSLICSLCS